VAGASEMTHPFGAQDCLHADVGALLPPDMAARAERAGVEKAAMDPVATLVLAGLAGAFITFGALFSTTVVAGAGEALPYGVTRLLAGLVFSLGLTFVLVGAAALLRT